MDFIRMQTADERLIFDSHAHYNDEKFEECRDELLGTLPQYGVCGVINCGCSIESSKSALALADKYDYFYAAVGIHPGCLNEGTDISEIERLAGHSKCVAIGEIGLDYYWEKENAHIQKDIFISQLNLARKLKLPVIIHDRDAHADTLEILKEYQPKGVVHCFSGSSEMAEEILKIGMYIGIGGVVTFKNAKRLPETVKLIPDEKLLLETDCPYLAPEPYRGKLCHSGMILHTAQKIAEIRETDAKTILEISKRNAQKLFCINE